MKLPGRTPVLVELDENEYNALSKSSDDSKVSMTLIVRDLIRQHLMKEELIGASGLSKRLVKWADKQAIVVHLADEEHDFVRDLAGTRNQTMTHLIRNLVRKYVMNAEELPEVED